MSTNAARVTARAAGAETPAEVTNVTAPPDSTCQLTAGSASTTTSANRCPFPGNTKGGSITVPLTSCLTGLESAV